MRRKIWRFIKVIVIGRKLLNDKEYLNLGYLKIRKRDMRKWNIFFLKDRHTSAKRDSVWYAT